MFGKHVSLEHRISFSPEYKPQNTFDNHNKDGTTKTLGQILQPNTNNIDYSFIFQ